MSRPVADLAAARAFVAERVEWYRTTPIDFAGVPTRYLDAPKDAERLFSGAMGAALFNGDMIPLGPGGGRERAIRNATRRFAYSPQR